MKCFRVLAGVLVVLLFATSAMAAGKKKGGRQETTDCLRLFDTYISMLVKSKLNQASMNKDYAKAEEEGDLYMMKMSAAVRTFTKQQMDYRATINSLKEMRLGSRFDTFRTGTIETLQNKNKLLREATSIAKSVLKSSPGIVTDKLQRDTARMPELTAQIEYLDETIFTLTKGIVMYAYDMNNRDEEDKMRLKLTRRERDKIIADLEDVFNFEDKENMNWITASAYLFHSLMGSEAKSIDE